MMVRVAGLAAVHSEDRLIAEPHVCESDRRLEIGFDYRRGRPVERARSSVARIPCRCRIESRE